MQRTPQRRGIDANSGVPPILHQTLPHKEKLIEILESSTSKSLLEMSRTDASHRQKNQNFKINFKRKLRLELWPQEDVVTCKCGQRMDQFGDHAFCCTHIFKTTMSNEIRDGIICLFKTILLTVRMISTTAVEKKTVATTMPRPNHQTI